MKEVIEKARSWALNEIKKTNSPLLELFEFSNRKGQELAEKLGVNKEIVMLGTLLMDIQLGQAKKENKISEHVSMGSEATKKFLNSFNLDKDTKLKIINCVEAHHGKVPFICKEAEICANADCYRFIHPKNIIFFITKLNQEEMTFEESLKFAYEKLEEKHKILSLDICKKELEPYYLMFKKLFEKAKEQA